MGEKGLPGQVGAFPHPFCLQSTPVPPALLLGKWSQGMGACSIPHLLLLTEWGWGVRACLLCPPSLPAREQGWSIGMPIFPHPTQLARAPGTGPIGPVTNELLQCGSPCPAVPHSHLLPQTLEHSCPSLSCPTDPATSGVELHLPCSAPVSPHLQSAAPPPILSHSLLSPSGVGGVIDQDWGPLNKLLRKSRNTQPILSIPHRQASHTDRRSECLQPFSFHHVVSGPKCLTSCNPLG